MTPQTLAPTRRRMLKEALAFGLANTLCAADSIAATLQTEAASRVPGEEVPVSRVWMAWPSSAEIWYDQLGGVQADIARLAKTIAKYTPVHMIANGARQAEFARSRIGPTKHPVTLLPQIVPDDMWMRDSGCVFRLNGKGGLECVKLNFNGWGAKQTHRNDAVVADQMATYLGLPLIKSLVVGEGGGVIQDGEGTLIANESSWVNTNRNPGKSRLEIEAELLKVYGASKMIWLPGIAGQDITDDHIDGTFQFFAPGKLVVQMPDSDADDADDAWSMHVHAALAALRRVTDAQGRKFSFVLMPSPQQGSAKKTNLLRSYVNYLVLPGAVVSVAFGDDVADGQAQSNFQIMYPGRAVEMIRLDNIYAGGGGIHCVTQQQPLI